MFSLSSAAAPEENVGLYGRRAAPRVTLRVHVRTRGFYRLLGIGIARQKRNVLRIGNDDDDDGFATNRCTYYVAVPYTGLPTYN